VAIGVGTVPLQAAKRLLQAAQPLVFIKIENIRALTALPEDLNLTTFLQWMLLNGLT
jgi:hypothetical protein